MSFAFKGRYEVLIQEYEVLTVAYPGWTLNEIKTLSKREREMWLNRAVLRKSKGSA